MSKGFQIQKITIKNFRSIKTAKINLEDISLFFGKNDTGKSNVLRALNLFFNDETDLGKALNFDIDFNKIDFNKEGNSSKKAREIYVELEISIPKSYHKRIGSKNLKWGKAWRKNQNEPVFDQYGLELKKREAKDRERKTTLGKHTRVGAALKRIRFKYIPAIKDRTYFAHLRGELYDALAEFAAKSFQEAGESFEKSIQDHSKILEESLKKALDFKSQLVLPKNLREIFKHLEFLDPETGVELLQRGDGIQAQHIPHILSFIVEQSQRTKSRGSPPYTFIWGYEEPENSLEISSCMNLQNVIYKECVGKNIQQALITTHSPVFYDSSKKTRRVLYYVSKDEENETKFVDEKDREEYEKEMGILPRLAEVIRERNEMEEKLQEIKGSIILVEGESDKIFFEELFKQNKVSILECGGESNINQCVRTLRKQQIQNRQIAVIVDGDVKKKPDTKNCVCYFTVPETKQYKEFTGIQGVEKKEFPTHLEMLYSEEVWEHAEKQEWLKDRKLDSSLPSKIKAYYKKLKKKPPLFALKCLTKYKVRLAKYVVEKCEINNMFSNEAEVQKWINDIKGFFNTSQSSK